MKPVQIIKPHGVVSCYGRVEPNSNFHILCEDERWDGVYCDGNPDDPDGVFSTWIEVVDWLLANYHDDIIEIVAI